MYSYENEIISLSGFYNNIDFISIHPLKINGDIMIFQNQDLPNFGTKEQMKKCVFMVLLYFLYIEE